MIEIKALDVLKVARLLQVNEIKFWQLQKTANLTNKKCAEYLGVATRSVERWRANQQEAPKMAILSLEAYIKENINDKS